MWPARSEGSRRKPCCQPAGAARGRPKLVVAEAAWGEANPTPGLKGNAPTPEVVRGRKASSALSWRGLVA